MRTAVKGKEKAVEGAEEELAEGVEALKIEENKEPVKSTAEQELAGHEEDELRELRAILFANVAACLIKLVSQFPCANLLCAPFD